MRSVVIFTGDCAKEGIDQQLSIRDSLHKDLLLVTAVAFFVLLAYGACADAPKTYMDLVGESVGALEQGRTTDALPSLRQALACNANDSLAHTALGFALLTGGRADEAKREFGVALQVTPDCAEATYGLGLVALAKPDLSEAARLFCLAQQARPEMEIESAIGYVKSLAGGVYEPTNVVLGDESAQALQALAMMKSARWSEALGIWTALQSKAARPGFGERLGCSMTFLRSAPISLTGWSIGRSYQSPSAARSKLPVVSGNVNLKADLTHAGDVRIVSFYVDGKFVGMTNTPPFNYIWDTSSVPNGAHAVKIQGTDAGGDVVSEKATDVMVGNKATKMPSAQVTGVAADKAWRRLWECMVLRPSAAAINYNLALCSQQLHDTQTAKMALERVLATDPTYMDAAQRLAAIYRPSGDYVRLSHGDGKQKVIALTFDDGPKKDAGRILDILKAKGVRATFFVVGKQADAFPDLVRRMASDGHEIGNHTYNHKDLEYLSERDVTQEIFKTVASVRSLTGREPHFLRPPGCHEGKTLPVVMRKFGFTTVFWSSNCARYEGTTRKKVFDYAVSSAKPGGVILLHNLELVTVQALPDIIDALKNKGYRFVTLSELR